MVVAKPVGRMAAEMVLERQRAQQAEHATRQKIITGGVAAGVVLAVGALMFMPARTGEPSLSPSRTTAPAASEAPATTVRGNIPKRVGELAGFGSDDAPAQNTFAINRITVDPPCSPAGTKPKTGHTVVLEVTVNTGGDADRAAELGRMLTPGFFSVVGSDGTEHGAWPGDCTDPNRNLPSTFTVRKRYSGTIELKVPEASGTLILAGTMENATGWEWRY